MPSNTWDHAPIGSPLATGSAQTPSDPAGKLSPIDHIFQTAKALLMKHVPSNTTMSTMSIVGSNFVNLEKNTLASYFVAKSKEKPPESGLSQSASSAGLRDSSATTLSAATKRKRRLSLSSYFQPKGKKVVEVVDNQNGESVTCKSQPVTDQSYVCPECGFQIEIPAKDAFDGVRFSQSVEEHKDFHFAQNLQKDIRKHDADFRHKQEQTKQHKQAAAMRKSSISRFFGLGDPKN